MINQLLITNCDKRLIIDLIDDYIIENQPAVQPKRRQMNPYRGPFRRQMNADTQLRLVSQPRGKALNELTGYYYIPEAGRGVTIYIIDSGANLHHPVSLYFQSFRYYIDLI